MRMGTFTRSPPIAPCYITHQPPMSWHPALYSPDRSHRTAPQRSSRLGRLETPPRTRRWCPRRHPLLSSRIIPAVRIRLRCRMTLLRWHPSLLLLLLRMLLILGVLLLRWRDRMAVPIRKVALARVTSRRRLLLLLLLLRWHPSHLSIRLTQIFRRVRGRLPHPSSRTWCRGTSNPSSRSWSAPRKSPMRPRRDCTPYLRRCRHARSGSL